MSRRNSNAEAIEVPDMGDTASSTDYPPVEWTEDHEKILVEWADKAMCYRWLHTKAHSQYSKANAWFTVPVIIMSTLTGTANFAIERVPEESKPWASMGIGAVNIVAGILTTIQQFLKISELNEAHRVAAIAWDKFYRNTKVELAKSPAERLPVIQMLKHAKEEFDRLMETSPSISEEIIDLFKKTFSDGMDGIAKAGKNAAQLTDEIQLSDKQKAYNELRKPEICDTLETTRKFVYKHKHVEKPGHKTTMSAIALARKAVDLKRKQDKVERIIEQFMSKKSRMPSAKEIMDELDGEVALDIVQSMVDERAHVESDIVVGTNENGDNMV